MRVCMLMTYFWPPIGGGQQQLYRLSIGLIRKGVRVSVLMRKSKENKWHENIEGIDVYTMPIFFRKSRFVSSFCYILFSFIWLIRNHKKYDIIHCHQAYSPATAGVLVKVFLKKKVVVKITASNEYGEVREMKNLPFFNIRKKLLSKVNKFILISPQVKRELLEIGIKEERMIYIPNGVEIRKECAFVTDTKMFFRDKLHLPYEKIVIFVGRLSEEKSLDTLLLAWKEIHNKFFNTHLLLVGDGGRFRNVEDDLKKQTKILGLTDTVHFLGRIDNVYDYLLASDIFVLPSISEGLSNALLEAMMAGLAIIASNIDANKNIIEDRINGLLFNCKNLSQLVKCLETFLNDQSFREKLGKAAKESAVKKYSMDSVVSRHLELYEHLLN